MSEQPPPHIPYATQPAALPPIPRLWTKFFLGMIGGVGLSAAAWAIALSFGGPVTFFGVGALLAKLAGGIVACCYRNWRPLGIGLLVSIPLAILIGFVGCAMVISASMN